MWQIDKYLAKLFSKKVERKDTHGHMYARERQRNTPKCTKIDSKIIRNSRKGKRLVESGKYGIDKK